MVIHENLPRVPKAGLKWVVWSKATELAKVARREGSGSIVQPKVPKAQQLPQEEFKCEVEKHLTGMEREP